MGFDLLTETKRAEFLDWIDNNLEKIKDFLILEHEDLLIEIYKHPEWIGNKEDLKETTISKLFKERNKLREFLKEYDGTKQEPISFKDLQKEIKMTETTLRKHITKMLEDGEIYEAKPKCFRWLG